MRLSAMEVVMGDAEVDVKIDEGTEQVATVVIDEPKENAPAEELTREAVEKAGFSDEEIVMAEKQGIIKKPAEPSDADKKKADAEKKKTDDKTQKETGEKTREELEKKFFVDGKELEPQEEVELTDKYNRNEKGLYFKAKKDHLKKQKAQNERDLLKIKTAEQDKELADLKKKVAELNGEIIPDEEDPNRIITAAELKEELDKKDKAKKDEDIQEQEKREKAKTKLESISKIGKKKYTDFDKTMGLAKEVLATQLEKSARARALHETYLSAIVLSDNEGTAESEELVADIAYEIGKLHPDYKTGTSVSDKNEAKIKSEKANLEKILANKEKQKSSAAIGGSGGGQRVISEDDLTPQDIKGWEQNRYNALSRRTKDRLLRESCGL